MQWIYKKNNKYCLKKIYQSLNNKYYVKKIDQKR